MIKRAYLAGFFGALGVFSAYLILGAFVAVIIGLANAGG